MPRSRSGTKDPRRTPGAKSSPVLAAREGIFGAIYWWMVKFGLAFAGLFSGVVMKAVHFDANAARRPGWFRRNYLYHRQVLDACRPFLNPNSRVLELGCSTGDMLNALQPGYGVGLQSHGQTSDGGRVEGADSPQQATSGSHHLT